MLDTVKNLLGSFYTPFIADVPGDCDNGRIDIVTFAFATTPDVATAYFMVERLIGANQPVGYRLYIDTNNNGNYSETVDRIVAVRYQASATASDVDVELQDGLGAALATIAEGANWGESLVGGGKKVEWGISFSQLGVQAGQPIRMYLTSKPGNTSGSATCDSTAEVQWSLPLRRRR